MNKITKKFVAYILIIVTVFSLIPNSIFAAVAISDLERTGMQKLRDKEGFTNITNDTIETEALKVKSDGYPLMSTNQIVYNGKTEYKYFNVGVYKMWDSPTKPNSGIIVYGERHGTKDKTGEYRYLGWNSNGDEVTNDRYINDGTSGTDLKNKKWQPIDPTLSSWDRNANNDEQRQRIMTISPIKNDGKDISYSISDILSNVKPEDGELRRYVQVMVGPTLTTNGTVKLNHKTSEGKMWYDSFTIPMFNANFNPSCTVAANPAGPYVIKETDTEITIPIVITANLAMNAPLGKTPSQVLRISPTQPGMVQLSYLGSVQDATITGSTATATYNQVFKRSDLKVGTNTVPLTGYISKMQSIYGDSWPSIPGSGTVTIEVKASTDPYVNVTATPVPDSVKFANANIPVRVNVSAALQGYTNVSNINDVVVYAKFDDDPANIFQTKTLAAATSVSTYFDFTIPASKVTADTLNQKFKVTVDFNYKTAVNNSTSTRGTTTCITNVYKTAPVLPPPPVPTNKPPVAEITSPYEVKAGDDVPVDGYKSKDEDGTITNYSWNTSGAIGSISGSSGTIWYPTDGTYSVGLTVTDNQGSAGYDSKSIIVMPPYPEANITTTGTLKENRKITIDASKSTSPVHYPMVWTNTTWSLSAVSGNVNTDIKYSGVLNGNISNNILVKRAGTDQVSLTVANSKPLTDTKTLNIDIAPDRPPVADFSTVTTVIRDPQDTNYSKITINDTSYSTDNDYIQNIILTVSYDSDNNGAFNNGSISIDASTYLSGEMKVLTNPWGINMTATVYKPAGKPMYVDIRTKDVGKYYVDLKAVEGFGQETIPDFITAADYRYDDTTDKPNIQKTIEVINLAPVAGFNLTNKRKVEINVDIGSSNHTITTVTSALNSIVKPALEAQNISVNFNVKNMSMNGISANKVMVTFKDSTTGVYYLRAYDPTTKTMGPNIMNLGSGSNVGGLIQHADGYLYYTYKNYLNRYNQNTGIEDTIMTVTPISSTGAKEMTTGLDGQLYLYASDGYTYNLFKLDLKLKTYTLLTSAIPFFNGPHFQVDKNGIVYYYNTGSEQIMSYNPATGATTALTYSGQTKPIRLYMAPDGNLYYADYGDSYRFYKFDTTTKTVTRISTTQLSNGYMLDISANGNIYFSDSNYNLYRYKISTGNLAYVGSTNYLYMHGIDQFDTAYVEDWRDSRSYTTTDTALSLMSTNYLPNLYGDMHVVKQSFVKSADYSINLALDSDVWSDDKEHYYVALSDKTINELGDKSALGNILTKIMNKNAAFVGLGKSESKTQLEDLVAKNDNVGLYIDNTDLNAAMTRLSDYILNKLDIDLVINMGNTAYDMATIQSRINSILKPKLVTANINVAIGYKIGYSKSPSVWEYMSNTTGFYNDAYSWSNQHQHKILANIPSSYTISIQARRWDGGSDTVATGLTGSQDHTLTLDGSIYEGTYYTYNQWNGNAGWNIKYYLRKPTVDNDPNNPNNVWEYAGTVAGYYNSFYTWDSKYRYTMYGTVLSGYTMSFYAQKRDGSIALLASNIVGQRQYSIELDGSVYTGYYYATNQTGGNNGYVTSYLTRKPLVSNDISLGLDNILSATNWRPTADHIFVDFQDANRVELQDSTKQSIILDNLRANEVKMVGVGTSTNSAQYNNLVTLAGEGTFIDNTNLDTAINALAGYIIANARRKTPNIYKYVLLNEEVTYNTTYADVENDPIHSVRWKYIHDELAFDSNLGKITDSCQYKSTPYLTFNKTGKYEIYYGARDNPKDNNLFDNYRLWSNEELSKATIYVHRKPIASYMWTVLWNSTTNKFTPSITDTSEDLDHISRTDKGIVQRQWKWKLSTDTEWQSGTPPELIKGNTYLVELMVQDMEGVWSEPYVQPIIVPDLIFDVNPPFRDWANTDVNINITTNWTGAPRLQRLDYKWTNDKNKPTTGWTTNTNYSFNLTQTLTGEWFMHISAQDTNGVNYYLYKGPYRIDKIAPTITADKTSADSNSPVTVNVTIADTGGSGIKDVKYLWSQSTTKPTSGWIVTNGSFSTIQDQEGTWYLHIEATDVAGNVTYGYLGSYKISTFKLEKFRVVKVRDLQLESYYYNTLAGTYDDKPMYVNNMAIDPVSFGSIISGLTKGYLFEFEIDSTNFNNSLDTIVIEPHFYTGDAFSRGASESDLYWEDSKHQIWKAGQGGHSAWSTVTLRAADRTITGTGTATWRGDYLIPGTSWAVPLGTTAANAKSANLKRDIIVNFQIEGYSAGVLKFDYNATQWPIERTVAKSPYQIGDVIKYLYSSNNLDDIKSKDNR